MTDRSDVFRSRNDGVVIPRIWVTIALSILIHIAALWELPPIDVRLPGSGETPAIRAPLTARLAPAPPQPASKPTQRAPRPKAVPRLPPAPPVIALKKPAPGAQAPVPVVPPVPAPKPTPPLAGGDMASYIEARRRARGAPEPAAPADDDDARRKRIVAGNLGSQRDQAFGYDPSRGGGMFQIERLSNDYAEFIFYGRSPDINRNTKQLIEVRRGNNSDIRIAVVRKMITIIREHEQEDFLWVSQRLGRSITLSARARDNTGLEEFMMREFFFSASPAQR